MKQGSERHAEKLAIDTRACELASVLQAVQHDNEHKRKICEWINTRPHILTILTQTHTQTKDA